MLDHDANHAALVRRYLTDVIGLGDFEAVDALVAEDVEIHGQSPWQGTDIGETIAFLRGTLAACDLDITVKMTVAAEDLVAARAQLEGTLDGLPAGNRDHGRSFTIDLTSFYRIADDRIVEVWTMIDYLALLEQLNNGDALDCATRQSNDAVCQPDRSNHDKR